MKPTEILMSEHRVIEQVLTCLEKMADRCELEGRLDAEDARDAVAFFRTFADRCHHGKEENQLFPLAEERGIPRQGGPIGVMVMEHEQGREAIRVLEESIAGASQGEEEARRTFVGAARDYIRLLREHIQKEDHCLFPMANQVLSGADQEELLKAFQQVEEKDLGPETHKKYLEVARRLADVYGVEQVEISPGGGCGHGGCSH